MSRKNKERRLQNKGVKENKLPLTLVQHPAAKKPMLTVVILVFLAFMTWTLFTGFKDAILIPIILMAIVLHGLIPYFFVTRFTFSNEGIEVKRFGKPTFIKWEDYRSYSVQNNGVVLWMDMRHAGKGSSFKEYLQSMRRSMFLPLDYEHIERVEEILSERLVKA
ncbi:hypothetical protein IJT10_00780 [bacterium]|nr:hypothetical protein [bacterium]